MIPAKKARCLLKEYREKSMAMRKRNIEYFIDSIVESEIQLACAYGKKVVRCSVGIGGTPADMSSIAARLKSAGYRASVSKSILTVTWKAAIRKKQR